MDGRNSHLPGWDTHRNSAFPNLPWHVLQNVVGDEGDFVGPPPIRRQKLEIPYNSTEFLQSQPCRTLLPTPPSPSQLSLSSVVCQIFILDNRDRLYAEGIKKRLLDQDIVSQISLITSPDGNFLPAIQDAAQRSLAFACTITNMNNLHQSMTVHILQGVHQEHRNMPLGGAIELIVKNFERLKTVAAKDPYHNSNVAAEGLFTPPDDNLKYLLNLAIDKKFLSIQEMDEIIDYFEERRDNLAKTKGLKTRKVAKIPLLPEPSIAVLSSEKETPVEKDMRNSVQSRLQEKIFRLLRGEPVEETPHDASLSASAGPPAGGNSDEDDGTIAQVLEILASNPLLRHLAGIPSPIINSTPSTGHHSSVQSLPEHDTSALISPSSSLYFKRRPLLDHPAPSWPPFQ